MRNGAKDAACLASSSEERKGKTKSCWSLNATKVHAENVRSIHRQLEKKKRKCSIYYGTAYNNIFCVFLGNFPPNMLLAFTLSSLILISVPTMINFVLFCRLRKFLLVETPKYVHTYDCRSYKRVLYAPRTKCNTS